MQKILIVEDDEKLRHELKVFLDKNGFYAIEFDKFENPVENILNENADLILLDINLPFSDGKFILNEIRKVSDVPIMMITSMNNDIDELISLNYGADHYVTKPFNIQILLAKITFILNISQSMIEKDDKKVELTKNELRILHFLVKNKNKIVSREDIMEYLWESESFIDDNTLTVNMKRLRNKLEELDLKDLIETKRGQGYILNEV